MGGSVCPRQAEPQGETLQGEGIGSKEGGTMYERGSGLTVANISQLCSQFKLLKDLWLHRFEVKPQILKLKKMVMVVLVFKTCRNRCH